MAGKSSPTITAEALVDRAAAAYLGFDTNVNSPGPACSIPLSPVISVSGEPFSRRRFRAEAIAESFMDTVEIASQSYTTAKIGCLDASRGLAPAFALSPDPHRQCYCTMRLNVAVWVIAFEPAPDIAVIVMG